MVASTQPASAVPSACLIDPLEKVRVSSTAYTFLPDAIFELKFISDVGKCGVNRSRHQP
jgi:hypothetical protein